MKKNLFIILTALMAVCMTSCGPEENIHTTDSKTAVTEVTYASPETTAKAGENKPAVTETSEVPEAAGKEKALAEKSDSAKKTDDTKKSDSGSKADTVKKTDSDKKSDDSKKNDSGSKSDDSKKSDSGNKTEDSKKSDGANKYGYYTVPEPLQTSISVRSLTGDWTDGGSVIEFADCDLLKGKFHAFGGDKSVSGTVVLEYTLNPDNTKEYWFNLYDDDGEFYKDFKATGEIPFNDLYTGQSGEQHFRRYNDDPLPFDFLGSWENGGVEVNITEDGTGSYTVIVEWPEEEGTFTRWEYKCYFDEDSHKLVCNGNGTCTDSKRSDGGTFTDEIKYENASALFSIDDVYLLWQDDNDTRDDGWGFLRN
ncbi:MAG: hypothetical protein IKM72_09435 [Oscillospiraceae bacterium]|nr:hypothetical protein [Oscillospiraceae bacterium]